MLEYVASSTDTLQSIAVAFNTTTTKLMELNKISSLTVCPGQTLLVPEESCYQLFPDFSGEENCHPADGKVTLMACQIAAKNQEGIEREQNLRESSGKHVTERMSVVPSGDLLEPEPFEEGFLKMPAYYISGKNEMVSGILLVTPCALMFDPKNCDPIAKRDGCEDCGVICPMEKINSVAMYNDSTKIMLTRENKIYFGNSMKSSFSCAMTSSNVSDVRFHEKGFEMMNRESDGACTSPLPVKLPFKPLKDRSTSYEIGTRVPGRAKLTPSVQPTADGGLLEKLYIDGINEHEDGHQMELNNEFRLLHSSAEDLLKTKESISSALSALTLQSD